MMPLALSAQIDLGIQAGPAFTQITFDGNDDDGQLTDPESTIKAGFQGGAFLRVNIKKLYLSPAVYYSLRQTEASGEFNGLAADWETTHHSLDVPLQVGYNIVDIPMFKLRAQTGPVLVFNFASETEVAGVTFNNDPDFSTAQLGWRIGAGVDVWKFTLDAGYEFGVTDISDSELYGNDTRNRANVIYALIGFKFL